MFCLITGQHSLVGWSGVSGVSAAVFVWSVIVFDFGVLVAGEKNLDFFLQHYHINFYIILHFFFSSSSNGKCLGMCIGLGESRVRAGPKRP